MMMRMIMEKIMMMIIMVIRTIIISCSQASLVFSLVLWWSWGSWPWSWWWFSCVGEHHDHQNHDHYINTFTPKRLKPCAHLNRINSKFRSRFTLIATDLVQEQNGFLPKTPNFCFPRFIWWDVFLPNFSEFNIQPNCNYHHRPTITNIPIRHQHQYHHRYYHQYPHTPAPTPISPAPLSPKIHTPTCHYHQYPPTHEHQQHRQMFCYAAAGSVDYAGPAEPGGDRVWGNLRFWETKHKYHYFPYFWYLDESPKRCFDPDQGGTNCG